MAQVITKLKQKNSETPIGTSSDYVICAQGAINLPLQDYLDYIKEQLEELNGTVEWEEV